MDSTRAFSNVLESQSQMTRLESFNGWTRSKLEISSQSGDLIFAELRLKNCNLSVCKRALSVTVAIAEIGAAADSSFKKVFLATWSSAVGRRQIYATGSTHGWSRSHLTYRTVALLFLIVARQP